MNFSDPRAKEDFVILEGEVLEGAYSVTFLLRMAEVLAKAGRA